MGWGGGVTADDDRGCYDPVDPPFDPEFDVTVFDVTVFDVICLYRKKHADKKNNFYSSFLHIILEH